MRTFGMVLSCSALLITCGHEEKTTEPTTPQVSNDPGQNIDQAGLEQHTVEFLAHMGLGQGAEASNGVRFSLMHRDNGQLVRITNDLVLSSPGHAYVAQDISGVYGASQNLVLSAEANGSSESDWAYWVRAEIHVGGIKKYDLIQMAPNAQWFSSVGAIEWGTSTENGTARYADVVLSDGQTYTNALYVHPNFASDGFSRGEYAALNLSCDDPSFCCPDATEQQSCGFCGTQSRTCLASGEWGAWSSCSSTGVCSQGTTKQESCGNCGFQNYVCNETCTWDVSGSCTGEGECTPKAIEELDCANNQVQQRICSDACTWSAWSDCGEEACEGDECAKVSSPPKPPKGACSATPSKNVFWIFCGFFFLKCAIRRRGF